MDGPRILSLFSGVGGLELACRVVWPGARAVGYVEREAYAASVLMARMEDSSLGRAPVWCGDVQELDGGELRGRVDVITAGFPCQDISTAGKGAGLAGERSGLWWEVHRLAREVGPRYLFLENVAAITIRGLDLVLGSLAEIGFDAEWLCLRASDVGAPHRRERWFCLAHSRGGGQPSREHRPHAGKSDAPAVAHTPHDHRRSGECGAEAGAWQDGERRRRSPGGGAAMAGAAVADAGDRPVGRGPLPDAERHGLRVEPERRRGGARPAEPGNTVTFELGAFPPGPGDAGAWRAVLERAPHLAPAVEPGVCVVADGVSLVVDASRADQLRCAGNGVVALQAAVALRELLRRMNECAATPV